MPTTINSLLLPGVLRDTVQNVPPMGTTLQDMLGMGLRGPNHKKAPTREMLIRVQSASRTVTAGVSPQDARAKVSSQGIGNYHVSIPRHAESAFLLAEDVRQYERGGVTDLAGVGDLIATELSAAANKVRNLMEIQIAGMLAGKFYLCSVGKTLYASLTQLAGMRCTPVDYHMPAANIGNLGGVIAAKWSNAATDIPAQIRAISAKMVSEAGRPLRDIVVPADVWSMVLANTEVRNQSGSASSPILTSGQEPDGVGTWYRLVCCANIVWHVVEDAVEVGPDNLSQQLIAAKHAAFVPGGSRWCSYLDGPGEVVEIDGQQPKPVSGLYVFSTPSRDPAGWEINTEFNGLPANYCPTAPNYGTVDW